MPEISQDELDKLKANAEEADKLKASNQRLLDESSKYKTRAQEAEGKLSVAEKAKLEAEGKTQELLDAERKEKLDLQNKYHERGKVALREKLRTEALKHAKDAHNIDMVLKVAEHKELLKLDEDSLTVEGVEEYVKKVRETNPYLFSKKRMDGHGDNTPPAKGDDDHKTDEQKYLDELNACTSRIEMNKVRRKYGKAVD